jgi:hypothetical protein
MLIIGKGTDPNLHNDVTIAFDKEILADLDKHRPPGGYPVDQEKAIKETRDRVAAYEAVNGVVDPKAVSAAQKKQRDDALAVLNGLVCSMPAPIGAIAGATVATMSPPVVLPVKSVRPRPTPPAPKPVLTNVPVETDVPVDMDKVYLVRLVEGDGDVYVKLVNGATYNFIVNGGRFPRCQIDAYLAGSDLIRAQDDLIMIDKNLATMRESERAGNVLPDRFNGEKLSGYSVSTMQVMEFVTKHGLTLANEEFEGLSL